MGVVDRHPVLALRQPSPYCYSGSVVSVCANKKCPDFYGGALPGYYTLHGIIHPSIYCHGYISGKLSINQRKTICIAIQFILVS